MPSKGGTPSSGFTSSTSSPARRRSCATSWPKRESAVTIHRPLASSSCSGGSSVPGSESSHWCNWKVSGRCSAITR